MNLENRSYPVKNADTVAAMRVAYLAKIAKNKEAGLTAFSTGDYKPFNGWSREETSSIFDITMDLDVSSQEEIAGRVVGPLRRLA